VNPGDETPQPSVVDAEVFEKTRATMGAAFIKLIQYFGEDGTKAVSEIEAGQREANAVRSVMPAHTLKSEARQFGGMALGMLAERIELHARRCVENHESPDELLVEVAKLRPLFNETLQLLERETNPLIERRKPSFGRAAPRNQSFGRI
jgi:HPt (histidine-containing phosphotransfer) domain-containing protein